jgi:hypothetical protein
MRSTSHVHLEPQPLNLSIVGLRTVLCGVVAGTVHTGAFGPFVPRTFWPLQSRVNYAEIQERPCTVTSVLSSAHGEIRVETS